MSSTQVRLTSAGPAAILVSCSTTASCLRWPSVPALVRELASWCLSANVRALGLRAVERHKVVRLVRSA